MGRAGLAARAGLWACSGSLALCAAAQAAPALVRVGDFASPTYATGPPDSADRVFVTERDGAVKVLDGGTVHTFLDLSAITQRDYDELGLLLVIGDLGQDEYEEIDAGLAANYGWSCFEGMHAGPTPDARCTTGAALPVLEKSHSGDGFCSITGGYVVHDPGLPTLLSKYIYGDFCASAIRSVDLANPASDAATGLSVSSVSSFGQDACGRIFVVSLAGTVSRLVDGALSPCVVTPATTTQTPVADTRACSLALRVTGLRSVRRRHSVAVALRTDEACKGTVSASSFRISKPTLRAGVRRVVHLRVSARGLRSLRRHSSLRVTVRVQAVDGAGNIRRASQRVRVRG